MDYEELHHGREVRYNSLARSNPERAKELLQRLEENAEESIMHILLLYPRRIILNIINGFGSFEPTIFIAITLLNRNTKKKITLINSVVYFYILSIFICPYNTSLKSHFLIQRYYPLTLSFTTSSHQTLCITVFVE